MFWKYVNFTGIFRTPFLKNTSGWLLLQIQLILEQKMMIFVLIIIEKMIVKILKVLIQTLIHTGLWKSFRHIQLNCKWNCFSKCIVQKWICFNSTRWKKWSQNLLQMIYPVKGLSYPHLFPTGKFLFQTKRKNVECKFVFMTLNNYKSSIYIEIQH